MHPCTFQHMGKSGSSIPAVCYADIDFCKTTKNDQGHEEMGEGEERDHEELDQIQTVPKQVSSINPLKFSQMSRFAHMVMDIYGIGSDPF